MHPIVLALAMAGAGSAVAAGGSVVTTMIESRAQKYHGSEHRRLLNEVAMSQATPADQRRRLQPILDWCDSKVSDDSVTYVSVFNDEQAREFREQHPSLKNVVLLDAACPAAYKQTAFYYVESRELRAALPFLDKAIAIAPFYAEPFAERGFILNQTGNPTGGADSYRQALALTERHPDPVVKAMSLRGLGYSYVELGDLGAARQSYEQSLAVDPNSKVATSELEYIAKEQAKTGAALSLDEDAEKAIALTRYLEAEPLGDAAVVARGWLVDWEAKTTRVSILVCDTNGLLSGKERKFTPELMVQGMFGNAAWQLEHPDSKDELAMQLAGTRSTLKAYAAILRAHPEERVPSLDALAKREATGELEAQLAPVVAQKCKREGAVEKNK